MRKFQIGIVLLMILINFNFSKAEWKIQKILRSNDSAYIVNQSALYDETNSSIYCNYASSKNGVWTYNLIQIDVNDLSKQQTLLKQKENSVYGIPDNEISTFRKINNSLVFLNKSGLTFFDLLTSEITSKKILDEYDNKIVYGFKGIQKVRDYYGKLLVNKDSIIFASKIMNIDYAEIAQYIPTAHIAKSYSEIWKYNNNKFELVFTDFIPIPEMKNKFSSNFSEIKVNNNDGFLLGTTKYYNFKEVTSLYKLSSNQKIKAFQEFDSVEVMKQSTCKNIYIKDNKIFAQYSSSSLGNDMYPVITSRILVYENEVPFTSFPLFKGLDAYDSDVESAQWSREFIEYKDFVFYVARENIYIIKNNKLSVLNIKKGMNDSLSDGHGQVIINDRGIYIFTVNGNILYNTNIDELISASGIDYKIDTKEYFNVLNNNINFLKQADSYMISDIQGRVYSNKANPNSVEALPDLANGTYFILAHYGENYISSKILITK